MRNISSEKNFLTLANLTEVYLCHYLITLTDDSWGDNAADSYDVNIAAVDDNAGNESAYEDAIAEKDITINTHLNTSACQWGHHH